VKRLLSAPFVAAAVLGCLALPALPAVADSGKPAGKVAEPRDLLDNRKILEATVAGFAKPAGAPADAEAEPVPPHARRGTHRLTLLELWDLVERHYPGLQAGRESVRSARFTRDEQRWLRLPSGDFNAYLSWSPSVKCKDAAALGYHTGADGTAANGSNLLLGGDNHPVGATGTGGGMSSGACLETDASLNIAKDDWRNYLPIYGALVRIDLGIRQPLFTFGKLDAALKLGEVGVTLAQAGADGARADLAVNLVRAYFGVKAARAALDTINDGREQLNKWVNQLDKELESGKTSFTEIDLMRLKVNQSALDVQISDAERLISSALAGLRFLAQDADADVDDGDLQVWAREEHDLSYYLDAALRYRPELRTLQATGEGARLYKKLRIAEMFPDIGLGVNLSYGYAAGIQDPANAFMNRFNFLGVGAGLGMRMSLDFGPKAARLQRALADLRQFEFRKREVLGAGALEVERQYNDLHEAQKRLATAEIAERRARGWLQGIKQNIDVGTAESRDMTEALRAYFEQHVNVLRAINDVNVQAAVLRRLCGLEVIAK
jgi:outer membrane protein TolC